MIELGKVGLRLRLGPGKNRKMGWKKIESGEKQTKLLQKTAKDDQELDRRSQGRRDRSGAVVRLTLWNHPGDGIYGMFARCKKLVGRMEDLLDGEVYHYHSKMILKDPEIGGAWEWHQDYGYWYHYGCLQPLMALSLIHI
mgnify:CR=1 FL=1